MERNEALLRKVGDVIANEPERYNQLVFRIEDANECGSVHCIAGWAVALSPDMEWARPQNPYDASVRNRLTGEVISVDFAARRALGLDFTEEALFAAMWRPAGDPSVPAHERVQAALYALADGASVDEVSADG